MTFRPFDGPELIETENWSVWLRFSKKVNQSEVHALLANALDFLVEGMDGHWEIRPIRRVEEREER